MPRLSRPRKRREEDERAASDKRVFDDNGSISIDFDDASMSKPFSSLSSTPSSSSPPHPLDAALDAIRSLPTFRFVVPEANNRTNFAALTWPFGGQKGSDGSMSPSIAAPSSSSSSSSSTSSSSSSPSSSRPKLPPVPEDLLSKSTTMSSQNAPASHSSPSSTVLSPLPSSSSSSSSSSSPPAKENDKQEDSSSSSSSSSSFPFWPPRFPSLPSSLPHLPSLPLLVALPTPGGDPEKRKLLSVADFFDEARKNSARLWKELDADGDGWASEADVARALAARGLPASYAPRVLAAARSGGNSRWWVTRLSRREFARWMERGEPRALRAFTSMALDRSGRLDARGVKDVLRRSGVAATDDAARGVLRALQSGEEGDGAASYAQFRSFVALLPPVAAAASTTTNKAAFSSRPFSSSSSSSAAAKNDAADEFEDDEGGSAPGFDPSTAWFDAASIVPLLSSSPAAASSSLEEESRAASVAAATAAAAATATTTTKAAAAASKASSTTSTATTAAKQRQQQQQQQRRQRQQKRAALLRAALAGGIASGATTLALFPLDCLKTRLQASGSRQVLTKAAAAAAGSAGAASTTTAAGASKASTSVLAAIVREGLADKRSLYRGVVPASLGSFFSHGLRTCSYEAALMLLTAASAAGASPSVAASTASQLRLQALASAAGTAIGTCVRIPTEVLKQRLQVGLHANALDAALAAKRAGGLPWSLFAGTGATLAREVPFYAAGMAAYEVLKNVADGSATSATGTPTRELARWEMVALGGCAGAIASLFTTPADVLKTKVMTAPPSAPVSAAAALRTILNEEGVLALWRGAGLRALWVAPLGAMNFAGYELAKRALERGGGSGSGSGSGSGRRGGESEGRRDNEDEGNDEDESQQQRQEQPDVAAIVEK